MKKAFLIHCLIAAGLAVSAAAQTDAQTVSGRPDLPLPNATSQRYEVNQAFGGQSFYKDNNIWVYTAAFAETFGMPKAGIGAIQGAEAAAFRMEDPGYKLCGMGGKADNCMRQTRYMLDVYIDERKTALPWASEQMADWLGDYNSSQWLRLGKEFRERTSGHTSPVPLNAVPNLILQGVRTLRPYVNQETLQEVFWMHNGGTDRDLLSDAALNFLAVAGYKRAAIANLTLVSFYLDQSISGRDRDLVLRLVQRPRVMSKTEKQFHEVVIPASLIETRKQSIKQQSEIDTQYYRSLFRPPLGTNPAAEPINSKQFSPTLLR